MLNPINIYNQIVRLTEDLIRSGLCNIQHFPSMREYPKNITEIGISSSEKSAFLKNIQYDKMYQIVLENKLYNMQMADGALITLLYRFRGGEIITHRLSYFPSPDLLMFQENPDLYMEDETYADILDRRIVAVPIRFDFDNRPSVCKPIEHPVSHMTLGQYETCRIPVSSALTPYQFISFVIMHFYHDAYNSCMLRINKDTFEECIFPEEKEFIYINTPIYRN